MLDLVATMTGLAGPRPVFASEADFQHALAWEIQRVHPSARIRLEFRPAYLDRRGYLDIWVADVDWAAAIELKYFTRALDKVVGDERFELLNQGAQDICRYDFVRDVARVEAVARRTPGVSGYALALTNDSSYWREPQYQRPTIDAAFRLHEGRTLTGLLGWSSDAAPGTTRGRTEVHALTGSYPLHWRDYSRVTDGPAGTFQYLLVEVPAASGNGDASGVGVHAADPVESGDSVVEALHRDPTMDFDDRFRRTGDDDGWTVDNRRLRSSLP